MMIIAQGTDEKMFNLLTKASIALMQIAIEEVPNQRCYSARYF